MTAVAPTAAELSVAAAAADEAEARTSQPPPKMLPAAGDFSAAFKH